MNGNKKLQRSPVFALYALQGFKNVLEYNGLMGGITYEQSLKLHLCGHTSTLNPSLSLQW